MPQHDWARVDAGIYHHFHNEWISKIHAALSESLPEGYYSMTAQHAGRFEGDVVSLSTREPEDTTTGGLALQTRPITQYVQEFNGWTLKRQRQVEIRHMSGDRIVAVIEIVSPGNKHSQAARREFVTKAKKLLSQGIHLLIVDPIQRKPTETDLHELITDAWTDETIEQPIEKPFLAVAYESDSVLRAYLEPLAVGDTWPTMSVFLCVGNYVNLDLEVCYAAAWAAVPKRWRDVIEGA